MTQNPTPETTGPTDAEQPLPAVEVDVARTGGIAGITRRWSAQPPETEASEWITLIDRCPWNEAHPAPGGAARAEDDAPQRIATQAPADDAQATPVESRSPMPDGFVWFIRASWSGTDPREAELYDDQVVGAWRELVDAVRDWSRKGASAAPERPGR
jgi:hypothetical protein